MNWKNVLYLFQVERKSGRLIRGIKTTRYKENSFVAYWPYWTALIIGVLGGFGANAIAATVYSGGVVPKGLQPLSVEALGFFSALPTLVLGISIVFTLLQQIQVSGKASSQVMYWLPITWQEHTLASILANLLGWPTAVVVGLSSGLIVFSAFNGLILQAILTMVILFAAAFFASAITEIVRVVQVRFTGAVYKSSGRAAIWIRFISTLVFIAVIYIVYFYAVNGPGAFIKTLTAVQTTAWYVPFVWPALVLAFIAKDLYLLSLLFAALSAVLIVGLYYLAVELNKRFGLYEPPAITVQKSGIYEPKTGLLGRLGFSTVEAALIRKDLRAFTRRRELLSIYIFPIIIIIVALFESLGGTGNGAAAAQASPISFGILFLLPSSSMAMLLGEILIGEEGPVVWRIYASPISPQNLVKSKYFITILFSIIILIVSSAIGVVVLHPTLRQAIIVTVETFLMVLAVSSISLQVGFKGADFTQTRRARMVRQEWSLVGLAVCAFAGLAVFSPVLLQYSLALLSKTATSTFNYAIGVVISAAISIAISAVFYKINIGAARELLQKAEV
jgi:hypothetical protein